MEIASFDDLLRVARAQPEPQRLLFVLAAAELPEDSSPEQRARFEAGEGGALVPLMSVDKDPDDLDSFARLAEESRQFAPHWSIVFASTLGGRGGRAPTSAEADRSLQGMVETIRSGLLGSLIPFNRQGEPLLLASQS